jgi:hypothetical protein
MVILFCLIICLQLANTSSTVQNAAMAPTLVAAMSGVGDGTSTMTALSNTPGMAPQSALAATGLAQPSVLQPVSQQQLPVTVQVR